jgi:hypothetical protein
MLSGKAQIVKGGARFANRNFFAIVLSNYWVQLALSSSSWPLNRQKAVHPWHSARETSALLLWNVRRTIQLILRFIP